MNHEAWSQTPVPQYTFSPVTSSSPDLMSTPYTKVGRRLHKPLHSVYAYQQSVVPPFDIMSTLHTVSRGVQLSPYALQSFARDVSSRGISTCSARLVPRVYLQAPTGH